MNRNGRWQSWVKLGGFSTAGVLSAVLVINTLSVPVRGSTVTYQAQFSSVEGLNVGNPVMMDGVRIGRVSSIRFASNRITYSVRGPLRLLGTENGNVLDHTPAPSAARDAFMGLCLGIFQATDQAGPVEITVFADGLESATARLEAKPLP